MIRPGLLIWSSQFEALQGQLLKRLKVLSNATLQIMFGTKRQEWSTVELHSLANMSTPSQMALYYPGCLLQKVLAIKAPEISTTLQQNKYLSNKEPNTLWSKKTGLLMLDLQQSTRTNFAHEWRHFTRTSCNF